MQGRAASHFFVRGGSTTALLVRSAHAAAGHEAGASPLVTCTTSVLPLMSWCTRKYSSCEALFRCRKEGANPLYCVVYLKGVLYYPRSSSRAQ